MIPASYLFKSAFDQAWTEPTPMATPPAAPRSRDGILLPLADTIVAAVHSALNRARRHAAAPIFH